MESSATGLNRRCRWKIPSKFNNNCFEFWLLVSKNIPNYPEVENLEMSCVMTSLSRSLSEQPEKDS